MTKLSRKKTDPNRFGHYVNNLWAAFTLMDSKEDIRLLFKGLFTHTEYKMFAKRLEIARRLISNETYENIEHEMNVTSHTVTRLSNTLMEKGEGLIKAHQKLAHMEAKYAKKDKEYRNNLSNPFKRKTKRSTLLGTVLMAGVRFADKQIRKNRKNKSAATELSL